MKKLISLLFLFSLSSLALAESKSFPEPFGLTWGMSEAALIKADFSKTGPSDDFNVFTSVSTPKAWSKADDYIALTYRGSLVKVAAHSKKFSSDLYGSEGKAEYENIKALLTRKYGAPESASERSGLKLYKDADEFYQCLKYDGCGFYFALLRSIKAILPCSWKGCHEVRAIFLSPTKAQGFIRQKKRLISRILPLTQKRFKEPYDAQFLYQTSFYVGNRVAEFRCFSKKSERRS